MLTRSPKLLLICIVIGVLTLSTQAQFRQQDVARQSEDLRKVIDRAIATTTLANGKVTSFRMRLPNTPERLITIEHTEDKKSFTMVDGRRRLKAFLDDDGKISAILLPDGKTAEYRWARAANGYWVPTAIKVDGKDLCRSELGFDGSCYETCRNAAGASAVAIGVCIASGPTSSACWSATAAAALATFACYACTHHIQT